MKRAILAAALAALATGAAGQTPAEAPKPRCHDPGPYPGRAGMQSEERRTKFVKALDEYKSCMVGFIEERKAAMKAHESAARAAIEEFNAKMTKLKEEQDKARE